jgi:hypothetical protein
MTIVIVEGLIKEDRNATFVKRIAKKDTAVQCFTFLGRNTTVKEY